MDKIPFRLCLGGFLWFQNMANYSYSYFFSFLELNTPTNYSMLGSYFYRRSRFLWFSPNFNRVTEPAFFQSTSVWSSGSADSRDRYNRLRQTCLLRDLLYHLLWQLFQFCTRTVMCGISVFVPHVIVLVQNWNNNCHNKCKRKFRRRHVQKFIRVHSGLKDCFTKLWINKAKSK